MGKILHKYEKDIDKAWFDSSNVLYAECNDKNQALKEVKVVFKNGSTYLYKDVKVNDWLMFRESPSNGKAFIKYIKNYEFEKLENNDVELLKEELNNLLAELSEKKEETNDRD